MRKLLITLTAMLATLAGGAPAHASGLDLVRDCTDDEVLSKTYTQKEYRDALSRLSTDSDQYGACRDIIARAQDAAATKGAGKGGSKGGNGDGGASAGGSANQAAPASPPKSSKQQLAEASESDRAAVDDAVRNGTDASVGPSEPIRAANVGRAPGAGQISDLPAPLLALLALLAVGGLVLGAMRIRSLVNARRT